MNQTKSKIIALIPARLESTRLPRKLLKRLDGKSIIVRTYEAVVETNLFDDVIVVCDDQLLVHEIEMKNGKAVLSNKNHESGSDRIAEIASELDADIIINIQGDEPFIEREALQKVIDLFQHPEVEVATLKKKITDIEQINNPNCVKVVTTSNGKALYFSRAPIPYDRDQLGHATYYQHIGVYGFRKDVLLKFTKMPPSELEMIEKLENLRMLENGIQVFLAEVNHIGISIDTEEDFIRAEQFIFASKME